MRKRWLNRQKEPIPVDVLTGYARWAKSYPPQAHNPLMQLEEQAMLSLLPSNLGGKSCLDLACGTGRYLLHLQARQADWAVGVDYSADMLGRMRGIGISQLKNSTPSRPPPARGRGKLPPLQGGLRGVEFHNLQPVRAPFFPLPFCPNFFDVIICGLAVGHEKNLTAALSEAARALRPGGILLYSDIHPAGTMAGWKRTFEGDNGIVFDLEHHLHQIDDHRQACRAAGLSIDAMLEPSLNGEIPAVLVVRAVKNNQEINV